MDTLSSVFHQKLIRTNMFTRTPGIVSKINISVADCIVSQSYSQRDGSINIFIEPIQDPIYPGPHRMINPLLTQAQPLLTPSTSSVYTPSHPPLSNLNTQTDMTHQQYPNNEQDQDNEQSQDTDLIGTAPQEPLFSSESDIQPVSPPSQDNQDKQDTDTMKCQDVPPAIQGTSSSTISHAPEQCPPSTYKLDAKKFLHIFKTKKGDIPIEGTSDQISFLSKHQEPKQVSTYKPCPKSKKKQLPQPDKDDAPTAPYSESDSDSDWECHIEKIEYNAQRTPQRAPSSSTPQRPTNQSHLTPGSKPAIVVQKLPIKTGDIEYDITIKQVLDRKRLITDKSSDHSSSTIKEKKRRHKHSKRDKDRDAN